MTESQLVAQLGRVAEADEPIQVSAYDLGWPARFEAERAVLT